MREIMRNEDEFGLEDFFDDLFKPAYQKRMSPMKTDVKEDEKKFEFDIDMPGFDKKEIDITFKEGYLNVSAKKEQKDEQTDKNKNYIRRERSYTACRSYYIGKKVMEQNIAAKYENGVLSIVVPKEESKQLPEHKIQIA